MSDQNSRTFRNMADRHMEETGEMLYSGMDSNGYYFSFGYFPKSRAADAMAEMQKKRDAVPHVIVTGMDDGKPFTYRQCPEAFCINAPHPKGTSHGDNTGATWRTRNGPVIGHDGE